jgi:hypothetical protein
MAKAGKIVARAPRPGAAKIQGRRAGGLKKPLAPKGESKLKAGQGILQSKSGRYIIASPVKSANTVSSWSSAFKEK